MHKNTRITDISPRVKKAVWERDHRRCVVCGNTQAMPNAHVFVSRAHGGKGIEENIATLCQKCHHAFDNGRNKEYELVSSVLYQYMTKKYPYITPEYIKKEITL